jgi:hypothetical protein
MEKDYKKLLESCLEHDDIIIYTSSDKDEYSYDTEEGGKFSKDLLWENNYANGK